MLVTETLNEWQKGGGDKTNTERYGLPDIQMVQVSVLLLVFKIAPIYNKLIVTQ